LFASSRIKNGEGRVDGDVTKRMMRNETYEANPSFAAHANGKVYNVLFV
jgi:hypothetical protein